MPMSVSTIQVAATSRLWAKTVRVIFCIVAILRFEVGRGQRGISVYHKPLTPRMIEP